MSAPPEHFSHRADPMDGVTRAGASGISEHEQRIMAAFQTLHGAVQGGLQEVDGTMKKLPEYIRSQFEHYVGNLAQRQSTDSRQVADLQRDIDELIRKNQSLQQNLDQQTTEFGRLRNQLEDQIQNNKKLHQIIQRSGEDESATPDPSISQRFNELFNQILQLVKGHFSFQGPRTQMGKGFDRLKQDDRDTWLRASVASTVHRELFADPLFGMREDREIPLIALEKKFCSLGNVPASGIAKWRMQTVKLGKAITNKKASRYRADNLYHTLCTDLEPLLALSDSSQAWRKAKDAIYALANTAYDLAINLRSSEATYEWTQNLTLSSVPLEEFERLPGFNLRSKNVPARPVLVLFGSVAKNNDGERIILRMGNLVEGEPLEG